MAATGEFYLRVLNADGTERLRIDVPVVDALSIPAEGFILLPRTNFYGVAYGAPGNDGYQDYVFDFDWETGKLLRAVPAPEMRR